MKMWPARGSGNPWRALKADLLKCHHKQRSAIHDRHIHETPKSRIENESLIKSFWVQNLRLAFVHRAHWTGCNEFEWVCVWSHSHHTSTHCVTENKKCIRLYVHILHLFFFCGQEKQGHSKWTHIDCKLDVDFAARARAHIHHIFNLPLSLPHSTPSSFVKEYSKVSVQVWKWWFGEVNLFHFQVWFQCCANASNYKSTNIDLASERSENKI